ncbi:hypothetical protein GCK32_014602, partial [Trichostrongylus colubriformis]
MFMSDSGDSRPWGALAVEAVQVRTSMNNLGKLSCLKKFACGNWRSYDVTAALSNGLMFCLVLQELEIRDISASVREELGLLVSRIPSNIQSLYLRSLEVTDVDMIDLCTRLSNLCGLRLARLPKVSSRGIHQSLTKLPRLQVLKCSVPISAVLLSLQGILIITVICSLNILLLFIVRGIIPIDGGLISKSRDGNCDSLAGLHFVVESYVPFCCGFRRRLVVVCGWCYPDCGGQPFLLGGCPSMFTYPASAFDFGRLT